MVANGTKQKSTASRRAREMGMSLMGRGRETQKKTSSKVGMEADRKKETK
jgi:hypothetical protein